MSLPPNIALFHPPRGVLDLGQTRLTARRTVSLTLGIGSGLFQGPGDHPGDFWCITDRGPNIKCTDAPELLGRSIEDACRGLRPGKIFPLPDYAPTIVRLRLGAGTFTVLDRLALSDQAGRKLSGLPSPSSDALASEPIFDLHGQPLMPDVDGVDPEGIVRLADGTFWIGEEFGPSLLNANADGRVQRRLVPFGTEKIFTGTRIPIVPCLPPLLARRAHNRGIEALGLSTDERLLWFMVQSPLANPDFATFERARIVRLFALRLADLGIESEHAYVLDEPHQFAADQSHRKSDVRIGDLQVLPDGCLLMLERIDATTKVYRVDPRDSSNLAGSRWDDGASRPSLEAVPVCDLTAVGVRPLQKVLIFDSGAIAGFPHAMEGLSLSADGRILTMISDNDFGIDGDETVLVRITISG